MYIPVTKSQLNNALVLGESSQHGLCAGMLERSNQPCWVLYNHDTIEILATDAEQSIYLDDWVDQGQLTVGKKINIGERKIVRYQFHGDGESDDGFW